MPTSNPPPPVNEKEIFQAAAALPPDERAACLDAACEGHPALRASVEKLLAALDDDVFMRRAADRTITPEVEAERARFKPEAPGDQIGNYTLREQIGEGGFGTVWVAEQEKPVRRRVALKIIKLGMDTREVIARFEQERQSLAMMDHPNIARVLDAGATSLGRPYFVMELVRGIMRSIIGLASGSARRRFPAPAFADSLGWCRDYQRNPPAAGRDSRSRSAPTCGRRADRQ